MSRYLEQQYEIYKSKSRDLLIPFEEFKRPKTFINFHERLVGTVVKKIDQNLRIYDHIIYFGCMLFFTRLTDQQIKDGPIVWEDQKGNAHCL